jgi:(p)ppGpp synthase/HD superfamily hydrolase
MATAFHNGQIDKSGEIYILHPLRVMTDKELTTESERLVAVLHDVLEDTECEMADLMLDLDLTSAEIIAMEAITHIDNEPNKDYAERIKKSPIAIKVKLADLRDNNDPRRMDKLDDMTKTRLRKKYNNMVEWLREGDGAE